MNGRSINEQPFQMKDIEVAIMILKGKKAKDGLPTESGIIEDGRK